MLVRLDEFSALFQTRLAETEGLTLAEPLATNQSNANDIPARVITLALDTQSAALLALTSPDASPQKATFVKQAAVRARARKLPYLIVGNGREFLLLHTPKRDDLPLEIIRAYPLVQVLLPNAAGPLAPPERIALEQLADQVALDLRALRRDGALDLIVPDADFFIARLTKAVSTLKPVITSALQTELGRNPKFGEELAAWAVLQGIAADVRSPDFFEAVARQGIYRLLGKIIFYQSLRRAARHLPELNLKDLDTGEVLSRLKHCFAEAHKIDYHAVFADESVVDHLPFPAAASAELRALVNDLHSRDFAHLPQDVVGAVFERLIPPEDRHALGQFFTPETLVDLIVGFCVRHPEDTVLDPTCGTGTFLIRAYDCLRAHLGVYDHPRLLGQLWGVDVAPFPAELATINLFRQDVGNATNFPRILNADFFTITPNGRYRFPPLKADGVAAAQVDEPIPAFNAIVGNFPYISADRLEKSIKNYRAQMNQQLATEWLAAYHAGFHFDKKTDAKHFHLAREKGLEIAAFIPKAASNISEFADLYVSLFWHAAAFLQPGGRMGIVTSNAWLDVAYGRELQQFFLNHFKIVAILESRCEPWFEQAAVNTVVTVLERCTDATERANHLVRFVQIKQPLAKLLPHDMRLEALQRWQTVNALTQWIEATPAAGEAADDVLALPVSEDEHFRVRGLRQAALQQQLHTTTGVTKWGPYLRAPQVYFELRRALGNKLVLLREIAPISRGSLTGINEFYHLTEAQIQEWGIEAEFLFPLLKSPGDSDRILIDPEDLKLKVFVCRLTQDELRAQGKLNTLRYIEWGEQQVFESGAQAEQTWPHGAEVKGRKPGWYALPHYRGRLAQLFFASAYGDRHIYKYSNTPLIADKRLYFLSPIDGLSHALTAAVVNSSVTSLFVEVAGRVSLGDGALELTVEDASDHLFVPDIRHFTDEARQAIEAALQPLLTRGIGSVQEEVQQADRQALDQAVLRALGLEPTQWLPRIYAGLTQMVRERTQLGKMRGQTRKARPQKAAGRVVDDVLADLLPAGPKRFPADFLADTVVKQGLRETPLPAGRLRYKGHTFGKEELHADSGEKIHASSMAEANYLMYAQANGQPVAHMPKAPVEVSRAVKQYEQYLRDLRKRLREECFRRTLDQAAAERFASDIWRRLALPEVNP